MRRIGHLTKSATLIGPVIIGEEDLYLEGFVADMATSEYFASQAKIPNSILRRPLKPVCTITFPPPTYIQRYPSYVIQAKCHLDRIVF